MLVQGVKHKFMHQPNCTYLSMKALYGTYVCTKVLYGAFVLMTGWCKGVVLAHLLVRIVPIIAKLQQNPLLHQS